MRRCLKGPLRTWSKKTLSLLFLLWICAILYNNINSYFTLKWKEQTINLKSLNTYNTTLPILRTKNVLSLVKDAKTKTTLHLAGNGIKYSIVIPSLYRNNNTYLKICLESLHKIKPENIPVFLVNGNNPPEKHTFLLEWCNNHPAYQCITPKTIPSTYFLEVIKQDKRNDTESYLKWRSTETEHAMFGIKEASKKNAERILFIQDDTFIHSNLFTKIELHQHDEIICLYKSNYCGMVGYALSRNFVQHFIKNINPNKMTMPIDWILDKSVISYGKKKIQLNLVDHLGKISSKTTFQDVIKN